MINSWEPIPSNGEEYGATYRGHYLDVYAFDGRWYWSAKHSVACTPRTSRGKIVNKIGVAGSLKASQKAAMTAVDDYRCQQ